MADDVTTVPEILHDVLLVVQSVVSSAPGADRIPISGLLIPTVAATLAIRARSGMVLAMRLRTRPILSLCGALGLAAAALLAVQAFSPEEIARGRGLWNLGGTLVGNALLAWPTPGEVEWFFGVRGSRTARAAMFIVMFAVLEFGTLYVTRTEFAAHYTYLHPIGFTAALVGPCLLRTITRLFCRR